MYSLFLLCVFSLIFTLFMDFTTAFWRLPCSGPVAVARIDPVVQPQAVASHEHTVMGGNAFNFTMAYSDTQKATCSTCKVKEDRSNYWTPNLYYRMKNGNGLVPVPQTGGATIYYLQRFGQGQSTADVHPFPEGLRMVAGSPNKRTYSADNATLEEQAMNFICLGGQNQERQPHLPREKCPYGLRTQSIMPSCWDGVNVDSEDHKSHMAYPDGIDNGACPKSHPVRLMTLFYEVLWSIDFIDQAGLEWWDGGEGHPWAFSNGDTTGYGFHADFVNGWHTDTLKTAIASCDNQGDSAGGSVEACKAFTFWDDATLSGCQVLNHIDEYIPSSPSKPEQQKVRLNINDAGSSTVVALSALPGCNAIVGEGGSVKAGDKSCGANFAIAPQPQYPYKDFTGAKGGYHYHNSLGLVNDTGIDGIATNGIDDADSSGKSSNRWKYVGCAPSPGGQSPTLTGPDTQSSGMTIEKCVAFCTNNNGKSYAYVGLENGDRCHCGDAVASDRMPVQGVIGTCRTACPGDDMEVCGGYGALSLYQACGSGKSDCKNAWMPQWSYV